MRTQTKYELDNSRTGFCGVWQDNRSADEIIDDIGNHRSGFGYRRVQFL